MKRKFLAMGLACMAIALPMSMNVYAQENAESVTIVENAQSECWDGTSTEMPTQTVLIDGKYYYQISNAAQLAYIAQNNSDWCDNNYILTNDIVLNDQDVSINEEGTIKAAKPSSVNEWTTIAKLGGHFDGAGYKIFGLYVSNGTGLFGEANIITNLIVENAAVKGGSPAGIAESANKMDNCIFRGYVYGTDFYNSNVAGVVSYSSGEITNCKAEGVIVSKGEKAAGIVANGNVVKGCTNYASVTAYNCAAGIMAKGNKCIDCVNETLIYAENNLAGGIVGVNYDEVTGCINRGRVIAAGQFAGGIVGEAKGIVSKCANGLEEYRCDYRYILSESYGSIEAKECAGGIAGTANALITDCINSSMVTAETNAGGIAGIVDYNYPGTIKNCINGGRVSATNAGGILGYAEVYKATESMVIDNCYNFASVSGDFSGGIAGVVKKYNINQCYSIGELTSGDTTGGIAGFSSHVSGNSTVSGCYYLSNNSSLHPLYAFGNATSEMPGVAEEKLWQFFPVLYENEYNVDPSYAYLGGADLLFFVNRMYNVALDRESEPAGRLNWFVALKNGTMDGAAIAGQFILGEEFEMRGLSDEKYVDALYRTIFGRSADITGKNHWLNTMASGYSRAYVLAQMVNLDEFTILCDKYGISRGVMLDDGTAVNPGISQFVSRLYNQVLGREPESAGLNNNVIALVVKAETAESVAKNFFGSEEYILKNTDNETYVKDLYAVFMGREADEDGLSFWVSCITEQGVSREWVLTEFAKSDEFKIIAASYGL